MHQLLPITFLNDSTDTLNLQSHQLIEMVGSGTRIVIAVALPVMTPVRL